MSHSEDLGFSAYTIQIRELMQNARDLFERTATEQDKYKLELESQREELVRREKELEKREAQHREREKHLLELEKKLAAKQAMEVEITSGIERALQAMQPTRVDVDTNRNKMMERIQKELKEKEEKLNDMERMLQVLSDENLEARRQLIKAMKVVPDCATIGVKLLGMLEIGQFRSAIERKYSVEEAFKSTFMLFLRWERRFRNLEWHPFKIISTEGITEEVIDEDDENLKKLRKEFGEELFKYVVATLLELKACSPDGPRQYTPELWNFKEGRKARLQEGVEFILNQWNQCKRQKN